MLVLFKHWKSWSGPKKVYKHGKDWLFSPEKQGICDVNDKLALEEILRDTAFTISYDSYGIVHDENGNEVNSVAEIITGSSANESTTTDAPKRGRPRKS